MAGICNPVAVLHTRVKKSQDLEQEFHRVVRGDVEREPEPDVPAVTFTPTAAMGYMFIAAKEVSAGESKFAAPAQPSRRAQEESSQPLVGNVTGIGGVVEILAKKYGCA